MWHNGIAQSQHYNNDNNDNDDNDDSVMCVSMWFDLLGGLFNFKNPWYERESVCVTTRNEIEATHIR